MEKRLVSIKDVIGQMARCAVMQHPYNAPPRLENVTAGLKYHAQATFADGVDNHRMHWFTSRQDFEGWLRDALKPVEDIMQMWNTPRSGHTSGIAFVSRYDGPAAEDDFIDIDALLRNVAMAVWNDSEECQKAA